MAAAQLSPGPGSVAARLTSARLTMLDNGWRPTPVSGKVCYLPGWGTFCDEPPSRAKVAAWATDRLTASHLSTGAALSQNEVVIDLDAMDLVRAQTLEALADHLFGWSPFRR